jgi:phosphorylcholine metabolism protein LicD
MMIDQYRQHQEGKQGRDAAKIKSKTPNGIRQQADNLQPETSPFKTKDEFMQQLMSGDEWENLSDLEKEKRKVELEALYDVYLETVRNSGEGASHALEKNFISLS